MPLPICPAPTKQRLSGRGFQILWGYATLKYKGSNFPDAVPLRQSPVDECGSALRRSVDLGDASFGQVSYPGLVPGESQV